MVLSVLARRHGDDLGVLLVHRAQSVLREPLIENALRVLFLVVLVSGRGFLLVVQLDLVEDEFLVLGDFQTVEFKVKVEIAYWLSRGLVVREVESLHVWMGQGLVDCDALRGVESQHAFNQIDSVGVLVVLKDLAEVLALLGGHLLHKCAIVHVVDLVDQLLVGLADQVGNHHHLLLLVLCGKERLTADKLRQDAADTPNVDGRCVLLPGEDDLGSPVPPGGDVVSQKSRRSHQHADVCASQPEVANSQIAVTVH
jgi:hypothetical protein